MEFSCVRREINMETKLLLSSQIFIQRGYIEKTAFIFPDHYTARLYRENCFYLHRSLYRENGREKINCIFPCKIFYVSHGLFWLENLVREKISLGQNVLRDFLNPVRDLALIYYNTPIIYYTPSIYAKGYIVFIFLFICLFVRYFVLFVELLQSFTLKQLKWSISH